MPRRSNAQLNIRSDKAKKRVVDLMYETGKTATQVVEDAVANYRPAEAPQAPIPKGMRLEGRFLVKPPRGSKVTLDDTNRAIAADRMRGLVEE